MICKNCGCGFKEGQERCPVCGTSITSSNNGSAMRGNGQQQFKQNSLHYNPQGMEQDDLDHNPQAMKQNALHPNPPAPQKGNGKKVALIISGLAVAFLLIIMGIVLLPKWIGREKLTESLQESTEDTGRANAAAGTESTGKKSSTESAVGSVAEDEFQELMKEVNELYNKKDYYNCWVKATVSMSNLPLTDVQNKKLQKIVDACKAEAGDYYLKMAEKAISNGKDTEFDTCTKYLVEMYAGDKEITSKVNKLKELKATNDEREKEAKKEEEKERYVVLDFSYELQSHGEYGDLFLSTPIHYCKGSEFDYSANDLPELKLDSKGKVKAVLEPGEWVFSDWQDGEENNGPVGIWKIKVVEEQLRNHEEIKMWLRILGHEDGVGYNNIYYKNDDSLQFWSDGYAEGMVIGTDGKKHSYTVQFEFVEHLMDEDGPGTKCYRCTDIISDEGANVPFKAGENYYFDMFFENGGEYGGDLPYDEKRGMYNVVIEIKDKNMEKTGYDCKYFSSQV